MSGREWWDGLTSRPGRPDRSGTGRGRGQSRDTSPTQKPTSETPLARTRRLRGERAKKPRQKRPKKPR